MTPRVNDHQRKVAAAAATGTLSSVAASFGISRSRVRSIALAVKERDAEASNVAEEEQLPLDQRRIVFTSMPTRIRNALLAEGYNTCGEVQQLSVVDVLRLPNVGRRSLRDLQNYLGTKWVDWNAGGTTVIDA